MSNIGTTSVFLPRYAEVLAHLEHFPRERAGEVRARLGVSEDTWRTADDVWTDALGDASRIDIRTALQFTASFARTRQRLARELPRLERIGNLPRAAVAPPDGEEASIARASPAPPVALPSCLLPSVARARVPQAEEHAVAGRSAEKGEHDEQS